MSKFRLFAIASTLASAVPASLTAQSWKAEQAVAIDGDTIDLGGAVVRLYGVDAPEAAQTCHNNSGEWSCGRDATALLARLIAGKQVICEQRDIDRYGRVVAVCRVGRLDVADVLVRSGLAIALPEFATDYLAAEANAKALKQGIWQGEFETPASFRAGDPELQARLNAASSARRVAERGRNEVSGGVFYANCNAARAAGAAPIYRGQPGYRHEMDGDNDGVACEPYRGR